MFCNIAMRNKEDFKYVVSFTNSTLYVAPKWTNLHSEENTPYLYSFQQNKQVIETKILYILVKFFYESIFLLCLS